MKHHLSLIILGWFRFWAKLQLQKMAPDIIGITGSAGKTSTRNAIYAILKDKYRVKVSLKANSESGIPLNILGLKPQDYSPLDWLRLILMAPVQFLTNWRPYDKYIVEMGIDAPTPPKNMEYLLTIIKPRTAVFLNALPVHTLFFEEKQHNSSKEDRDNALVVKKIAEAKGKLIESLPINGLAVLNADDKNVVAFKDKTKAQVMIYGKSKHNDIHIVAWKVANKGTTFRFKSADKEVELTLPYLLPEHFGSTFAAALCLALDEDQSLEEGCELLAKNFTLPRGRTSLIEGHNHSLIIDSSYNASPQTMLDMLTLLAKVPAKRKLVLLGDMRELGHEADNMHEQVVRNAMKIADEVHLVGPLMRANMVAGAYWYENAQKAGEAINLQPQDVILVKGSQNTIFLETAVEKLMAHPEKANSLLCRRGTYWDTQRAKQ